MASTKRRKESRRTISQLTGRNKGLQVQSRLLYKMRAVNVTCSGILMRDVLLSPVAEKILMSQELEVECKGPIRSRACSG